MGFGYLLIGFLMFLDVGMRTNAEFSLGIDVFPDILGYILIYLAMVKLADYAKGFKYTKLLMLPLSVIGIATLGVQIAGMFVYSTSMLEKLEQLSHVLYLAKMPFHLLFYVCVFWGIRSLSKEESVDLPKATSRSEFGIVFAVIYFVLYFLAGFVIKDSGILLYLNYIVVLSMYALMIFTALLFHYCYSHICYEGEEELAEKEHSFSKLMYFLSGKGRDENEDDE